MREQYLRRFNVLTTDQQLLTAQAFAKALNVTTACIRRWILERKIATVKLGRLVRIPSDEVQRLIQSGLRPTQERRSLPKSDGEVSNGKK